MHYIINPIYFYLIDLAGSVVVIFTILSLICLVAAIVFLGIYTDLSEPSVYVEGYSFEKKSKEVYDADMESFQEKRKRFLKTFKKFIVTAIILFIITLFIPSEKTCYQMMVASIVTEENIEKVEDKVQAIIEYAVELQDARDGDE